MAETNTGTTSYGYDAVGNLQTVTYPNGVVHSYGYDTRNRLTNLGVNGTVAGAPGMIAGYAYTLDASGHRTGVTELSGRTVSYGYDNLYRLTSETIAGDPHAINGVVSYAYDPVGNRTQKTSTLPGMPGGLANYNANDQLSTDTYDANGNTTASVGLGYAYDFENHLIQQGGISIVYDGDGNRASKTVNGVTTTYLVDTQNPTGYAQVLLESFGGRSGTAYEITHTYVYGLERISERRNFLQNNQGNNANVYYVYDGHGSVRALTDQTGTVTDTYDYDAFGNLLHSTGSTPNNYLYSGEQFDPDLGLYYNRARYLNVSTGRFWNADQFEGTSGDPGSHHRFLYAFANPVDYLDPSGKAGNGLSNLFGDLVQKKIFRDYDAWRAAWQHVGFTNRSIKTILSLPSAPRGDDIYDRPDIADVTDEMIYEIKPKLAASAAYDDIAHYIALIMENGGGLWLPGTKFSDEQEIPLIPGYVAIVDPTLSGAILYTVASKTPIGIPLPLIPQSPDTISEEAIKQEIAVANEAEQAEEEELVTTAPVVSLI